MDEHACEPGRPLVPDATYLLHPCSHQSRVCPTQDAAVAVELGVKASSQGENEISDLKLKPVQVPEAKKSQWESAVYN